MKYKDYVKFVNSVLSLSRATPKPRRVVKTDNMKL